MQNIQINEQFCLMIFTINNSFFLIDELINNKNDVYIFIKKENHEWIDRYLFI